MNISFSPILDLTVKRATRRPAESINSHALMELQNLYTDQFETSSQCSAISDRSEIGEDFWERRETQSEASESSERSVELNFSDTEEDSLLDLMDIQSEVSNPGVVQTHQPARQAATAPNPINGKASTESQGLPPDYFETSSQSPISDLTEIGEDFWERRETQSEASESSERSVELNFFDSIQLNLSDTEDNYLDTLFQTRQPANQAATVPNPINGKASTESQGFPPDYFETSSQSPISDRADTSSPFVKSNFFKPISQSSESEFSDMEEDDWERRETQSEASNSGGGAFFQTWQPARQALQTPPPFRHRAEAFHTSSPFPHGAEAFHPHPPFPHGAEALQARHSFDPRPEALQARHSFDPRPEALQARHSFDPRPEALQAPHLFDPRFEALHTHSQLRKNIKQQKQQREAHATKKNPTQYPTVNNKKQREDARAKQLGFKNAAERRRKQREAMAEKGGFNSVREFDRNYHRKRALKKAQMENQGEALSPVVVDTLLQTRQPANQAPITQNPFHHTSPALPPRSPLPTPPKQEERTSRHKLYQGVPASEQTDNEFDSFDQEVKTKAGNRLARRKSLKTQAYKLKITIPELLKRKRQARAEKHGFKTIPELYRYDGNRVYREKNAESPV